MSVTQLNCKQVWNMRQFNEGNFGRLHKGTIKEWNGRITRVAVKIMKGEKTDDATSLREISQMARFNHPNIVKLVGVVTPGSHSECYCDPGSDRFNMSWIVMEYFPMGSLEDFLRSQQTLTLNDMIKIAHEVALGMNYLHIVNVIHRDLAARNILMTTHNSVKIGDFGICREDNPNKLFPEDATLVCKVSYAAPETMPFNATQRAPIYTKKMDVWSFGVVVFEIWSRGQYPFYGMKYMEVVKAVFNRGENVLRYAKPPMYPWVENLMEACFRYNRANRPDFDCICQVIGGYR